MDTIREYLESVFARLPRTQEMERLKHEMLVNMEDKYVELTEQGVPENEAIGIVLTEFGNVEEIVEAYNLENEEWVEEDAIILSEEEADNYFSHRVRFSIGIGIGVFLCIMAPAMMLLFLELSHNIPIIRLWPQTVIDILSLVPLFVMIAIGVGLFIILGYRDEQYGLEKQFVSLKPSTRVELAKDFDAFKPRFAIAIASGVALCILAPLVYLLSTLVLGEENYIGVALLLGLIAIGVFLFVVYGIQHGTYQKLLGIGDYTPEKVEAEKFTDVIASILFPLATVVFLIAGVAYNAWGTAWIVFPIAGILFGIISIAYQGYLTMKKRKLR